MRSNSCVHPFTYVTAHDTCIKSCQLCEQKCPRLGHPQPYKHIIVQIQNLIQDIHLRQANTKIQPAELISQIQKQYQKAIIKLDQLKNEAMLKIKQICEEQLNNQDYNRNIYDKIKLLQNRRFDRLTCCDVNRLIQYTKKPSIKSKLIMVSNNFRKCTLIQNRTQPDNININMKQLRKKYYQECTQYLTQDFNQKYKLFKEKYEKINEEKLLYQKKLDERTRQNNKLNFRIQLLQGKIQSYKQKQKTKQILVEKQKQTQQIQKEKNSKKDIIKDKKKSKQAQITQNTTNQKQKNIIRVKTQNATNQKQKNITKLNTQNNKQKPKQNKFIATFPKYNETRDQNQHNNKPQIFKFQSPLPQLSSAIRQPNKIQPNFMRIGENIQFVTKIQNKQDQILKNQQIASKQILPQNSNSHNIEQQRVQGLNSLKQKVQSHHFGFEDDIQEQQRVKEYQSQQQLDNQALDEQQQIYMKKFQKN